MGTSAAWDGSMGSDWSAVRRETQRLLDQPDQPGSDPGSDRPEPPVDLDRLVELLSEAIAGDPEFSGPAAGTGDASASGAGRGGGSSAETAVPPGGGRRLPRSATRAASAGGRVLGAGLAFQRGDADTLASLGLDLGDLASMNAAKRCNTILNTLLGADGSVAEVELREVNSRVLWQIFQDGLNGLQAMQAYLVEYVMQVYASEAGSAARDGRHDGARGVRLERELRGLLAARARRLSLGTGPPTPTMLREALSQGLRTVRDVLARP